MPTETFTKDKRVVPERAPGIAEPEGEDTLRALAIQQIHRVRAFKLHVVTFALGIPVVGGVWVLTEYYEEHTWPSRFADAPDVAGTWSPWFFWFAGIWLVILAVHGLRTYSGPSIRRYIRRPPTREEVDREIERLRARR